VGGWIEVPNQSQISNLYYDDGSGTLATFSKYGVHWVFLTHDGQLHVVYGQGDYIIADALDASVPAPLPGLITDMALLVAKIIIEDTSSTFYGVYVPWVTDMACSFVTLHNELAGLQGGILNEYYHLSAARHTDLTDGGDSTLHYHASDRARANHTGTQTRSTISDWDHASTHQIDGPDSMNIPRGPTLVVAASDAKDTVNADYICDGTADESEIETALSALPVSGGTVYLTEGTFSIGSSIDIPKNNVILRGSGWGTTIKIADSTDIDLKMIDIDSKTGISVRDVALDGNKANQTSGIMYGINLKGSSSYNSILNVCVHSLRNALIRSTDTSTRLTVRGCRLHNGGGIAITAGGLQYSIIISNIVYDNGNNGIQLGADCNNCIISNNQISGNTFDGIRLASSSYNLVEGNSIFENLQDGIQLDSASHNIVSGNLVTGNSQSTDDTYMGIQIVGNSDYNSVQDNLVRHLGGAKQHKYGIDIQDATCDDNLVTNNDIALSGKTASLNDGGTGTVTVAGNRT